MFGFFANLVSFENVREALLKETTIFIDCLEDQENSEVVHRIVYIADEFLQEDEINIFIGKPDA